MLDSASEVLFLLRSLPWDSDNFLSGFGAVCLLSLLGWISPPSCRLPLTTSQRTYEADIDTPVIVSDEERATLSEALKILALATHRTIHHAGNKSELMDHYCINLPRMTPDEAYKEFEHIHPFVDGNGRVGKIIFNWKNGTLASPAMPPNFWGIANP